MVKKVLITGLDGFTGHYLEKDLQKNGHQVIGLKSDLLDFDAVNTEIKSIKPDAVAHLAAVSFVMDKDVKNIYGVNVVGTQNLLNALYTHSPNVKSILLASSATVYGNTTEGTLTEQSAINPANDYGVSKIAMEYMARLWKDKLPLFIVRPFNYTGIGQEDHFLIPKIIKHFKQKNAFIELGNIDVWREFGDVRYVSSIYRQLLEQQSKDITINICTGKSYSIREVIDMCECITGHKIEIKVNPKFVRANDIRELKGDPAFLNQHVKKDLDYKFESTLKWMLE